LGIVSLDMAELVTDMQMEHVKSVVEVHLQSFRDFFLTFLGRNFLSELYRGILTDPSGIALVAVADERITGFVAGTEAPAGFYKRLLRKRWWRFAWASLPAIIKKTLCVSSHFSRSFDAETGHNGKRPRDVDVDRSAAG